MTSLLEAEGSPALELACAYHERWEIELAIDEARRLGHNYIGTEHLLLGLVREGEGIAAGVDEVIMLDATGYVAEASGMNLFAVSNSTLRTPPPA